MKFKNEFISPINMSNESFEDNQLLEQLLPSESNGTISLLPFVTASSALQMPSLFQYQNKRSWSSPSTPSLHEFQYNSQNNQKCSTNAPVDSLLPMFNALSSNINTEDLAINDYSLKNDLLVAADSVTNAMQSLVKELHFENESCQTNTSDDEDEDNYEALYTLENFEKINNLNLKKNKNLNSVVNSCQKTHSLSASVTPLTYRKHLIIKQQELITEEKINQAIKSNR